MVLMIVKTLVHAQGAQSIVRSKEHSTQNSLNSQNQTVQDFSNRTHSISQMEDGYVHSVKTITSVVESSVIDVRK